MLPKSLKSFTAFVDGRGYLGRLNAAKLPALKLKTEEHRDGGMDAAVDLEMGMEKLEFELTFAEVDRDLVGQFGKGNVPVTIRGSQEGPDGTVEAIEVQTRGLIREVDKGDWKAGDKAEMKLAGTPVYYRLRIAGVDVVEIDVENGIRRINGEDQLAARRAALGV
jgi:P2 family phage contractile tail tube protein